jgi:hypothetical protein
MRDGAANGRSNGLIESRSESSTGFGQMSMSIRVKGVLPQGISHIINNMQKNTEKCKTYSGIFQFMRLAGVSLQGRLRAGFLCCASRESVKWLVRRGD